MVTPWRAKKAKVSGASGRSVSSMTTSAVGVTPAGRTSSVNGAAWEASSSTRRPAAVCGAAVAATDGSPGASTSGAPSSQVP